MMDLPLPKTKILIAIGILLLAVYVPVLRYHIAPYASDSDASGYMNFARLLAQGEVSEEIRQIPGIDAATWDPHINMPLGYNVREGRLFPSYPVGLPLHLLVFSPFFGLDYAAIPLNIVQSLVVIALMFAIGRELGLTLAWRLVAIVTLALCPLYLFYCFQVMSDQLATLWALVALLLALKSRKESGWAVGTGIALSLLVWTRPAALVAVVPVVLAMGYRPKQWLLCGLAGVPGAIAWCWLNNLMNGSPWKSGYNDLGILFSKGYVVPNLIHFAKWFTLLFGPVVVALAVSFFFTKGHPRNLKMLLGAWFVAFVAFYMFYFHSGETWWYLRFILPVFPAVVLAAALSAQTLLQRATTRRALYVAVGLIALTWTWELVMAEGLGVWGHKKRFSGYVVANDWIREHAPANAVVLCMQSSGSLFYYTNFKIARYDHLTPTHWAELVAAAQAQNFPIYAALHEFEIKRALQTCAPGDWEHVTDTRLVAFYRLKGSGPN